MATTEMNKNAADREPATKVDKQIWDWDMTLTRLTDATDRLELRQPNRRPMLPILPCCG